MCIKRKKNIADPKDMFQCGYDFYKAAIILNNNNNFKFHNISCININPIIVNISFACEIFIKTIYMTEESTLEYEHKLSILFNKLTQKSKNEILSFVQQYYVTTYNEKIDINKIQKRLKEVGNYFVDQRYWFEQNISSPKRDIDYNGCEFLKVVCDGLITVIQNILEIKDDNTHQIIV